MGSVKVLVPGPLTVTVPLTFPVVVPGPLTEIPLALLTAGPLTVPGRLTAVIKDPPQNKVLSPLFRATYNQENLI
jgi:hypothetical protein